MAAHSGDTDTDAGGCQVLLLDLRDDAEAAARYDAAHRPCGVPEPVLNGIRAAGIREMEIHRAGNRLVMLLWTAPEYDAAARAAADRGDPAVREWEERMDALQRRLPFAEPGEKWVPASRIFALSHHAGGGE